MTARFDISTATVGKLDKRKRLTVNATPTRAGIFTYFEHDGSGGVRKVKELRHPDDVFSRETMDSLKAIPYTTQANHVSLMTPENVRERTYGTTLSNVERKDEFASVGIKINDGKEIKAVQNKESLELSCGYDCDIVRTPGEYEGERYDQRQINIVYDHVARVEKARGGTNCRIRLDSESAICGIEAERLDSGDNSHNEDTMTKEKEEVVILEKPLLARVSGDLRLDADSVKIPKDQAAGIVKMLGREEKIFAELEKVNSANTEKQVKLDAQDKKISDLEKQIENAIPAEKFDSEMDKRLKTWDLAKEYKVKDYQNMSVKDLNVTIAKGSNMFNDERMDDEQYVNFCIEHLQTEHAKNVSRSRDNLQNHQNQKLDMNDGDLSKPSRLEVS